MLRSSCRFTFRAPVVALQEIPNLGVVELGKAARSSVAQGDLAEDRWQAYAKRTTQLVSEMPLAEVSRMSAAFSVVRVVDFDLFARLSARALQCLRPEDGKSPELLGPGGLKQLAQAFGKVQVFDAELMEALVPLISNRIQDFKPKQLVQIADAYARLPLQSAELFALLADALPSYLYDLEPPELASLCRSFAEAAVYNAELTDAMCEQVVKRARSFGATECVVFLDGLSRLHSGLPEDMQRDDSKVVKVVGAQLFKSAHSLGPVELIRAFAALVRLDHYDSKLVHNQLCATLALKLPMLTGRQSGPTYAGTHFNELAELLHCLSLLPAQSHKSAELALETTVALAECLKARGVTAGSLGQLGLPSAASVRPPQPRAIAQAVAAVAQLGREGQEDEDLLALLASATTFTAGATSEQPFLLGLASDEELQDLQKAFSLCRSSAVSAAKAALALELRRREPPAAP